MTRPTYRPIVVAASADAAKRLAQRTDAPTDLGAPADPARAAAGWRRYGWPVPDATAPSAADEAALLAKVRKLLTLADASRGATEAEASNAAAAAQRLIEQHNLDVALLDEDATEEAPPRPAEPVVNSREPLYEGKQVSPWRGALAGSIARANGCRIYWEAGRSLRVIGTPTRVAAVRYLYVYLSREIDRLGTEAAAGRGRSYGHAWRLGCVARIGERLAEASRVGREQAKAKALGNGVALVRVERALATISAEGDRAAAWMKANLRLKSTGRSRVRNTDAYAAGRAAGDRIKLGGHAALGRGTAGRIGGGS